MKLLLTVPACLLIMICVAQPNKKPAQQPASQAQMDKMLEAAMKAEGMSKEEQAEMKKMMKDIMPALNDVNSKTADYPQFTTNKQLVPKKDPSRIASLSKKALIKTEVAGYTNGLYNKMMMKGDPAEMALVKKVVAMTPKASDISGASVLAMLQGHPQAALALSIKAAATDPASLNLQNNMAAMLTSYGYPEQAMPVLRKLQKDLPVNSTILNNLGQAWLGLGELDSAKRFFSFAGRANPQHPEASLCGGLMEELTGDPVKAGDEYKEAMENSPNPFTEQVLKNHDKNYNAQDLDFEKIKKMIVIYEYFPKNWMPEIPELSNNVRNYNADYSIKVNYEKMISDFNSNVSDMTNRLSKEVEELADKGEQEFIKEMATETMKGLSFMSKPATVVLGVLGSYQMKWQMDQVEELKKMLSWKQSLYTEKQRQIDAIYKQITDTRGVKCEDYKGRLDELENNYMQQVNPRFRNYLLKKTEEFRQWLNAWCTWNWYVAGNVKNTVLIQDVGFTGFMAELYGGIVSAMETRPEHCNPKTYDVEKTFTAPEIPNFTCPAVVSIPAGPEWQSLVAASRDFNNNKYGITKTDKPVPNVSVAYGTSDMVAQPGKAPFIKTANGSITPGMINNIDNDQDLASSLINTKDQAQQFVNDAVKNPAASERAIEAEQDEAAAYLRKEFNKLVQEFIKDNMSKEKRDRMDKLGELLEDYKKMVEERKNKNSKDLLTKMLTADCDNKNKDKNKSDDEIRKMAEEAHQRAKELIKSSDAEEKAIEAGQDEAAAYLRKEFNELVQEFIKGDISKEKRDRMDKVSEALQDYKQILEIRKNGLQPTISSGLQAPGTASPNKAMFQ